MVEDLSYAIKTANELRNLLDEYKNNNQSTANLEAIVNQQTNDLCNKLNEGDCVTVSGGNINIKMDGEPKIFVKHGSSSNNTKFIVLSLWLFALVLFL